MAEEVDETIKDNSSTKNINEPNCPITKQALKNLVLKILSSKKLVLKSTPKESFNIFITFHMKGLLKLTTNPFGLSGERINSKIECFGGSCETDIQIGCVMYQTKEKAAAYLPIVGCLLKDIANPNKLQDSVKNTRLNKAVKSCTMVSCSTCFLETSFFKCLQNSIVVK